MYNRFVQIVCKCFILIDELTRTIAVVEIKELTICGWFCEGHAESNAGMEDDIVGQKAGEACGRRIVSQHTLAQSGRCSGANGIRARVPLMQGPGAGQCKYIGIACGGGATGNGA